ncbi:MAG: phage terminase large subunit [Limisphaerales bacterium]
MIANFGARRDEAIQMSEFQRMVLEIPQEYSIFLGGGRGGGKSFCCALLCLKHAAEFGNRAHMLYLRRTHRGTQDFAAITMEVFDKVYGTAARFNSADGFWKLPNGATLEVNQCETQADLFKFTGRSKSLIIVDEAGHYPDPMLIDRMRSNLRSIATVPTRLVLCANPGDSGHGWIQRRYINPAMPWRPFLEKQTGVMFVSCPSTFIQNEFIDQSAYKRDLIAATSTDLELQKAWLEGSWAIARGAFFGAVLDESINGIAPWEGVTARTLRAKKKRVKTADGVYLEGFGSDEWRWFIAHDFGTAAPS